MATLLFRMVGGSHLYGTCHAGSDFDHYEIWDKCKPFHEAHGDGEDITRWPLSMLMRIADKGGHNALDVMFTPHEWAEVDLIGDLRASYRANPWKAFPRFIKTAENMRARGDYKGQRHAQRLMDNLDDIMHTGRYDPRWIKTNENTGGDRHG